MKKIMITGSSGFIGRHVLDFLNQQNDEIYPLKIHLDDRQKHASQMQSFRPKYLLHLAWETTPGIYWHAPSNLQWLKCSLDLIEDFGNCGGERVIIAGSCAEMFPHTLYGASKEAFRLTASALLQQKNISTAWARLFSPYGPYEKSKRLIPSVIQTLLSEETFHCVSEHHVRDFLFVEDIAEAIVQLLQSDAKGIVDIGSGRGCSIGEMVKLIALKLQALDRICFSSSPLSEDNPSDLIANPARLSHEIGFKPKYTLEKGIEKTVNWWRNEIYH